MADLEVDLDGLSEFADNLERIRQRLSDAKAELRADVDALGDHDVIDGIEHFESHWRDGRKKIEKNAKTLATMASTAVDRYRATDGSLARSLDVNTTHTSVGRAR